MSRLLLIEDEPGLTLTLSDRLRSVGYTVETAADGVAGLSKAKKEIFDLIILDVMMPRMDGFEVCRELRRTRDRTPVLMLTARGETYDKVGGLKLGADDYVTKPFDTDELLARIEALLRRSRTNRSADRQTDYHFGNVVVSFDAATVTRDGEPVEISARLFRLLRHLIENRGRVLTRDELLDEVWGHDAIPSTRTVDVHIAWLRQRIETDPSNPRYLVTVRGLGYRFDPK